MENHILIFSILDSRVTPLLLSSKTGLIPKLVEELMLSALVHILPSTVNSFERSQQHFEVLNTLTSG